MRSGATLCGVVSTLLAVGCSKEPVSVGPDAPLPPGFAFEGTAEHAEDGWTVRCEIDASLGDTRETPVGWSAAMSGRVVRTITYPEGQTWTFDAVIVAERMEVAVDRSTVSVPLGGDQPADARAFWKELSPLVGTATATWTYAGEWACLGIGADVEPGPGYAASGTWTLKEAS